jgi:hypothetical protein
VFSKFQDAPRPDGLSARDRFAAWACSWHLDEELAGGADPDRTPMLAHRASRLSSAPLRHQMAVDLRTIVADSRRPRRLSLNGPTPRARAIIRDQGARLEQLADRLDGRESVGVQGVAAAMVLVADIGSPLWSGCSAQDLARSIDAALIGLES